MIKLSESSLRDYQRRDVNAIRQSFSRGMKKVIYVLPTGGGKTVVFSYITQTTVERGKSVLILTHRDSLLIQSSRSLVQFGVPHGFIKSGFTPTYIHGVQIASVQSLKSRLTSIPVPSLIIIDECFPAGTDVSGTEIQNIKTGDTVSSFNHDGDFIEQRKVVALMERDYSGDWYLIISESGRSVVCTENHPFYTLEDGYVNAKNVNDSHTIIENELFKLQSGDSKNDKQKTRIQILYTPMCRNISKVASHYYNGCFLLCMRKCLSVFFKVLPNTSFKKASRFLFGEMQVLYYFKRVFGNNEKNKSSRQGNSFEKNEGQKSYVKTGERSEDDSINERKNVSFKGWKRTTNKTADSNTRSNWISNGTSYISEKCSSFIRIASEVLQGRFSCSGSEIVNRGGRNESQAEKVEILRCEKNGGFEFIGVARVEVYKQGSGCRPNWVPEQNTVYNIEVEGNHNYFANGILVHNCHHATTKMYTRVVEHFTEAYVLGVTATPVRMDGQGLGESAGGMFQSMILGPSTAELTDDGYLVRSKVFGPERHIDFSSVEMDGNEYDSAELDKILNRPNITGDVIKQYVQVCPNAPAIVFCCSRSHAQNVAAEFRAAGYRSVSVDSTMDDTFIRESLAGLGTGGVDIITSCDLISEGTDIPVCAAVIMLRKTKSLGLFLQMYGRALRVVYAGGYDTGTREGRLAAIAASEKPHAYILDHVGNVGFWTEEGYVVNHGWATDPRTWTLEGKKKGRKRAGDIAMVKCKQCTQCFAIHLPAPKCDQCGFVYPIAEVEIRTEEGQLREISPEERMLVSKNKRKEQGRSDSLKELELIAEQRGYQKGWAKHILKSREDKAAKKAAAQAGSPEQINIQQQII